MSLAASGIAFPEDMKGKRIGFTDKDSMITQLGLAQLRGMNIDPATYFKSITYYNDVDGVLAAMKYNLIDVGVANSVLFNAWTNKGNNINLIMQGNGVPHLTFAVRGDLPASFKDAVTQALLTANQDHDAQEYFKYSSFPGFEPAKVEDFAALKQHLKIQ
jgi:ABC-type phosphate/phosphonate transport system substrate-binding protein